MTLLSRADLQTYANVHYEDNTTGEIDEEEVRTGYGNMADSAVIKNEAGDLGAGLEWNSNIIRIKAAGVTLAMMENRAQSTFIGRKASAGSGAPQEMSATEAKAILAIAATDVSGLATVATSGLISDLTGTLAIARIADGTVTAAKLADLTGLSVLGRSTNSSGVMAAITGTDGQALRVSGTALGFGTIVAAGIASDAVTTVKILDANVTLAKMANLAQATIIGRASGAGTGVPTALASSDLSTILGLGTAAFKNIGLSGDTIPKNDTGNTFSVQQTISLNTVTAPLILESTESSTPTSLAAELILSRSVNTAANMFLGGVRLMGKSASGTFRTMARQYGQVIVATNGAESAVWLADTIRAGTVTNEWTLGGGLAVGAPTGMQKGIGTVNAQTLYQNGTALGTAALTAPDGSTLEISGTTLRIKDAGVVYAKIQSLNAVSVMGRSAGTSGVGADIQAANDGDVLRRSGSTLGFGTITTAGIADNQVTLAKMSNLAQSTIIGRAAAAGTGVPTALTGAQVKTILAIAQADVSGLTTADSPSFAGLTLTNNNSLIVGTGSWLVPGYGPHLSAQNGNYTFVLGDGGTCVRHNNTTLGTYTIPPNSSVAFPLGTRIDVVNIGSGSYKIQRGAGVTMYVAGSNTDFTSTLTWSTIIKVDTDTWMFREI